MVAWLPLTYLVIFELLVIALFLGAVVELYVLYKGFLTARNDQSRGLARDDSAILLKSPLTPPILVAAVPPDCSETSRRLVHDLVKLHYGDHEVLLVLEDPSDEDLARWVTEFRLFPSSRSQVGHMATQPVRAVYESHDPIRLTVIEKERGGTADSLNVALNLSTAPLVAVADFRASLTPDALLRAVRPFLEQPELTVASCATIPPAAPASLLERLHTLESLRGWLTELLGMAAWNAALPPPGAFVLFQRAALLEARGFHSGSFEMMVRLHATARARKQAYCIGLVHYAVAEPRPPRTVARLRWLTRQRQREVLAAARRHHARMFGFGGLGWGALPLIYWEWAVGPVFEALALALLLPGFFLGWVHWPHAALLLLAVFGTGTLSSMSAVVLREFVADSPTSPALLTRLFLTAAAENLVYRRRRTWWLLGGLLGRPDGQRRERRSAVGAPPEIRLQSK